MVEKFGGNNEPKPKQICLDFSSVSSQSNFNKELAESLAAANIPLFKVDNSQFRQFLHKHMNKSIPSYVTLRNKIVDSSKKIQKKIF